MFSAGRERECAKSLRDKRIEHESQFWNQLSLLLTLVDLHNNRSTVNACFYDTENESVKVTGYVRNLKASSVYGRFLCEIKYFLRHKTVFSSLTYPDLEISPQNLLYTK